VPDLTTAIGTVAALFTTFSHVPQLKKCWDTGEAGDLSLMMLLALMTGLSLWVVYGVFKSDTVIILANAVALLLLAGILYFKVRSLMRQRHPAQPR
jgi:MtN3 and saliva related transmembrane protein